MPYEVIPVGFVESPITEMSAAPRQADEGAPPAWLVFDPEVRACLTGLKPGDRVVLVTWLDRARRDLHSLHPRGDTSRPRQGVFATRSAARPNPIGLHEVEIVAVDGLRIGVDRLEALNGTPILDLKPVLQPEVEKR